MFEMILAIASFALACGGLVEIVVSKQRRVAIVIIIVALAVLSSIAVGLRIQHARTIERIESDLRAAIGTGTRTFEDMYQALYYPDFAKLNEAIDGLVAKKLLGHKMVNVRDEQGLHYRVRCYFLVPQARRK